MSYPHTGSRYCRVVNDDIPMYAGRYQNPFTSAHNESGDACGTARDGKAVNLIERVRNRILQLVNVLSPHKINGRNATCLSGKRVAESTYYHGIIEYNENPMPKKVSIIIAYKTVK